MVVSRGIPNPLYWKLPARLRRARKAAGLSCSELSRRAGMGTYTVAAIEAGNRLPRLGAVERLGDALRVSAAYLAYGLDVPWAHREGDELRCAGLAARAKEVRERAGLSLRDVSSRLETSASTVQAFERGGPPRVDKAEQLATALGVSPAWLAFGEGSRDRPRRGGAKSATGACPPSTSP